MQINGVVSNYSIEQSLRAIFKEINKMNAIAILDRLLAQDAITSNEYINTLRDMLKS